MLPRKNKYASNDGKKFNNCLISGVNLCSGSQKAYAMQQYVHQQGQPHGCNLESAKEMIVWLMVWQFYIECRLQLSQWYA